MEALILTVGRPESLQPLTSTRDLADMPLANRPLLAHQQAALAAAGCTTVRVQDLAAPLATAAGPRLLVRGDVWLGQADLACLRAGQVTRLMTADDELPLAWTEGVGASDVTAAPLAGTLWLRYPWQFLTLNEVLLAAVTESDIQGSLSPRAELAPGSILVLGAGSRVLPGVYIEGTVVIGKDCKVGPNCYLRGPTSVGDHCHIGQAVEIKATIILDHSAVPHLSYVGDSIIGAHANFGAGSITANLRHDNSNHRSMVNETLVDTGRRKLGVIVGDHVHLGINTSLYPARKIWPHAVTLPGEVVTRDIASDEPQA